MWSSVTGTFLDCSHIAGEKNEDADWISRWDGTAALPGKFLPESSIQVSLEEFWNVSFKVSLFPSDAFLLWGLPAQHTLGPSKRGQGSTKKWKRIKKKIKRIKKK